MVKALSETKHARPRVLVVEPDRRTLARILQALESGGWRGGEFRSIDGLDELTADVAASVELIVCAWSVLRASDFAPLLRTARRFAGLPLVATGQPEDARDALGALRAGAGDFVVTSGPGLRMLPIAVERCVAHHRTNRENDVLRQDLQRSLGDLEAKNRELEEVINQLEIKARTDALTGLANRRWLNLMTEGAWAEAERNELPLACLMLDLDAFKGINDRFGHQRGDEALRAAARVIQANCRAVDITARYGGDEFCVIMPHTEPHEAALVAERILQAFRVVAGAFPEIRLGMSIGLSHRQLSRPRCAEQLVAHADEALYAAKSAGKNRVFLRDKGGVFAPMTKG
jgi:diguanylate cyclase (GGDEF)-like protein